MKRILFLTPYLPSNKAGGENFTRLLLQDLSVNNKIDLIYYKYNNDPYYIAPNDNISILKVQKNSSIIKIKNILKYLFIHPIFSIRFERKLLKFIQTECKNNKYDILFLDHSQMFIYGKYFPKINKILMSHDIMAQRFSRTGNWLNKRLIIASEKQAINLPNSTIFTFSLKDKKIIYDIYNKDSRVTNFILDKNIINAIPTKIENQVIFFGKWKREDNLNGLKWYLQHIHKHINPQIKVMIIGIGLPQDIIHQISEDKRIEYKGFVENPYRIIANSLFVLSPLFSGAGVKVKVVESLACGTPVIGTDIAFEGIDTKFKEFMIYASTPIDYIKNINEKYISLNEREQFKKMFINTYNKSSISTFISSFS